MYLISAEIGPFRSINDKQTVSVDEKVTVLVGMNEAGKTVFLKALEKAQDALETAEFNPIDDYPRRNLPAYLKTHKTNPSVVTTLTYRLTDSEIAAINKSFNTKIEIGFTFSKEHYYDNNILTYFHVSELPVVEHFLKSPGLTSDTISKVNKSSTLHELVSSLESLDLNEKEGALLDDLKKRISKYNNNEVIWNEIDKWLTQRTPKFLYFGEYEILPSKMNLLDLSTRLTSKKNITNEHLAVNALLRMADISIDEIAQPEGYETLKAKIEGVSISLTDQIKEFWKQNEDLEVEVDIKSDSQDEAPFNNGANLYLRIKNRRHRVGTPFRQRSRGFIWFFSFLVWFDSVKDQINSEKDIILLLDEPGLSLHALAQEDLLNYIDTLSEKHQVLYSTHSPFMIHSDRLSQVRVVEDKPNLGSLFSENISSSDPRTIFPLQAALGYTIAQNLFISERNLLVEGPSDLIYLKNVSAKLEELSRVYLNENITIVPTGGLDKVVTFISLLGANGLKIVVLHDDNGKPEQKIIDLVKQKIVLPKQILTASKFRDPSSSKLIPSDTEDLFDVSMYLKYFNETFSKQLNGSLIVENQLPKGDRIIQRIEIFLKNNGIQLRPSGGFNHYAVSSYFASNPPASFDNETLNRFESLFKEINILLN